MSDACDFARGAGARKAGAPADSPMFSVVIPTFDRADRVFAAIDSVFAQTCDDYELIVVDDGSTDDTWRRLQAVSGAFVAVRQDNAGPGAARNAGAARARGRYLAFLDSDDVWFPWTLDLYRLAIGTAHAPGLVAGRRSFEPVSAPGAPRLQVHDCLLAATSGAMPPLGGTPAVAIRKDVFKACGGFSQARGNAEDIDLWLRLGEAKGFCAILEPPIFLQRRSPDSINLDLDGQYRGALRIVASERAGRYPGGVRFPGRSRAIVSATARSVSLDLAARRRWREAFALYRASSRLQLLDRRWRYLLGFPVKALLAMAGAARP